MTTAPSLTMVRRLDAPPAKVYEAWIDPSKMKLWWGPAGAEVVHAEADPRVGGNFRVVFTTPDGENHDVSGTYREAAPSERLAFTWAWRSTPERQSLVTVDLAGDGDGTQLTLTHEQFFDEAARDRHRGGWNDVLDRLQAVAAAGTLGA